MCAKSDNGPLPDSSVSLCMCVRMCEIKTPPSKKDKGYLEQARQRE